MSDDGPQFIRSPGPDQHMLGTLVVLDPGGGSDLFMAASSPPLRGLTSAMFLSEVATPAVVVGATLANVGVGTSVFRTLVLTQFKSRP